MCLKKGDKYPCCVCTEPICLGSNCPAEEQEEIFIELLQEEIDEEIPPLEK